MGYKKLVVGGETKFDLSATTATEDTIMQGFGCYDANGDWIDGKASQSGGGLPSGIAAFDYGDVVVSSAFTTTRQTFNHSLGVTPDLMIVYAPANIATTYSMLCAIRGNVFGWRASNYNNHMAYHGNSSTNVSWTNSSSTSYGISNMTATTFQLASASSSYYWRAGTYRYIAIKFR